MDDIEGPLEPSHWVERHDNVRIVLDDERKSEDRRPVTIRILFLETEAPDTKPARPSIRIIHEAELAQMMDDHAAHVTREDAPMTLGEIVTLLISVGVLIYLIYALLWPERF